MLTSDKKFGHFIGIRLLYNVCRDVWTSALQRIAIVWQHYQYFVLLTVLCSWKIPKKNSLLLLEGDSSYANTTLYYVVPTLPIMYFYVIYLFAHTLVRI